QPRVQVHLAGGADGEGVVGGGAVVDQRVPAAGAVRRQAGAAAQVLVADGQQAVDLEGARLVVGARRVPGRVGAAGAHAGQAVVVGLAVVEQLLDGAYRD